MKVPNNAMVFVFMANQLVHQVLEVDRKDDSTQKKRAKVDSLIVPGRNGGALRGIRFLVAPASGILDVIASQRRLTESYE